MRSHRAILLPLAAALACGPGAATPAATPVPAAAPAATPRPAPSGPGTAGAPASSIAERSAGYERQDGLLPVYYDERQGKLLLEIPHDSMRVLTFTMLATGLGSNPIGLDRGMSGDGYVTRFQRAGDRVLVIFENWNYRSSDPANADLRRTVQEAFPPSTVAALPLLAVEGGRLLVDATELVMRDWMEVARTLQGSDQGSYSVARDRSYIYRPNTKAFPRNTEIDVALTFATNGNPGRTISMIAPDARNITLHQHLSFVALPDSGYRPRAADPRVGYFGISFKDYAQPIEGSLEQRWASRHRLERVDPSDPNSPIKNPIHYYVDRGIPEPLRTATLEGARFWSEAFDRAGLKGGFVVDLLPEGVDPMDVRYNVVQWINRNERGWSVGGSLADPRTGEILKGMARLDSHRNRTAYNLFAGLMGADTPGDTAWVLGRVRQVTAHEIGHTLGLAHNYIASTYERGSLMDYPAPRVRLDAQGNIDLTGIYDVGPGAFDVWAIRWGYGIFPAGAERDSLAAIVREGLRNGLLFLSDADARPDYASDPRTNLWDDAATPAEFLRRQMAVRRVGMERFGLRNIKEGEPVALLQERFAPVYFMHRFAMNSLAKSIGGMEYSNAVRGDGQQATRPLSGREQRAALSQLTALLAPAELAIPDTVVALLAPRPYGYGGSVELFRSRTQPAFDEFGAARTLSQMIVDAILQPQRAARLVMFSSRDRSQLSLGETIDSLVAATWRRPAPAEAKLATLQRVTQRAVAEAVLRLAANDEAAPGVRAMARLKLQELQADAARRARAAGADVARAHWLALEADIARWFEDGTLPPMTPVLEAPPGDPFGSDLDDPFPPGF
ncbi:MAG TPA: zinc-dependent metalloprotease [Gemmatimonadaceae bacterium]|nr:zinc-dependent metalloprotease [Gemmatimonadaceae bacterium]